MGQLLSKVTPSVSTLGEDLTQGSIPGEPRWVWSGALSPGWLKGRWQAWDGECSPTILCRNHTNTIHTVLHRDTSFIMSSFFQPCSCCPKPAGGPGEKSHNIGSRHLGAGCAVHSFLVQFWFMSDAIKLPAVISLILSAWLDSMHSTVVPYLPWSHVAATTSQVVRFPNWLPDYLTRLRNHLL